MCVVEERRRKRGSTEHDPRTLSQIDAISKVLHSPASTAANMPPTVEYRSHSANVGDIISSGIPPKSAHVSTTLSTESRIIDGIEVDANKIDICFSR